MNNPAPLFRKGHSGPDPVRRKFEDEIDAGHVLLVVDGDEKTLASADVALAKVEATALPFDSVTALT